MKAILEFDLPEDAVEFDRAIHGVDYFCALSEFLAWMRNTRKSGDYSWSDASPDAILDTVWTEFHSICEDFSEEL